MSKRSFFRQPFGSPHVNGSQTQMKSARPHFDTTVTLIWDKLSWRKFILVRSDKLGLFVNTLTADDKYTPHNSENFLQQIQMILTQKPKFFSRFSIAFVKWQHILSFLKIKMNLIA